jgi:hypothetical protein
MWSRKVLAVGLIGVLVASSAGCTAGHDDMKVIYKVTGGATEGTIAIEYIDSEARKAPHNFSGATVDWSQELTLGDRVSTAHVNAHTLTPAVDTKLTLTCVIIVDGKEVKKQSGWQQCEVTVELDDL